MGKLAVIISVVSIAFAYIESSVVVYLRQFYYPDGFSFPLAEISSSGILIELGREVATIVLLAGLGWLAGKNFRTRFAWFCFAFGVWDIFYYIWLKVFLNWPEFLLTWDVLFLIPLPWIGPVLSPVIVSTCLIAGATIGLYLEEKNRPLIFTSPEWGGLGLAGLIIIGSYMYELPALVRQGAPEYYPWWIFISGLALGAGIFINRWRRSK